MTIPNFDNFVNKVKDATKQTLDKTTRTAKHAKLKIENRSLQTQKMQTLQNMGIKLYDLHLHNHKIDGDLLDKKCQEDFKLITQIDLRLKEIEREIEALQLNIDDIEVKDITSIVKKDS